MKLRLTRIKTELVYIIRGRTT